MKHFTKTTVHYSLGRVAQLVSRLGLSPRDIGVYSQYILSTDPVRSLFNSRLELRSMVQHFFGFSFLMALGLNTAWE